MEADEDFTVHAVFLKLTSVGSREDGYLTAYQPGPRPVSSSVNYLEGETLGGAAFASVGIVDNIFAVRIYTSQTTHLVVDVPAAGRSSTCRPRSCWLEARVALHQGSGSPPARVLDLTPPG